VGAPKFLRNFDPSVAEVIRTVGKSEGSNGNKIRVLKKKMVKFVTI